MTRWGSGGSDALRVGQTVKVDRWPTATTHLEFRLECPFCGQDFPNGLDKHRDLKGLANESADLRAAQVHLCHFLAVSAGHDYLHVRTELNRIRENVMTGSAGDGHIQQNDIDFISLPAEKFDCGRSI